jgi:CO/xanthine dehydrogenase Mo-binding subunit
MLNPNLEYYKISMAPDCPEIVSILTEVSAGGSNAGAVGIGEPTVVATAGAIANAVYNACGARVRELPITPARVLAALQEQRA